MKVALVHDWLNQIGGAESVLIALKELFPEAPVYTSIYDPTAMPAVMQRWEIRTSAMDRIPRIHQHHQAALPLYPFVWEQFDFSGFDLVLSNKSGFCHGIITPPETLHLCYCLTPTRYLWNTDSYLARENVGRLRRTLLPPLLTALRLWDHAAAQRVDGYAAISRAVQDRIENFYQQESTIIYPPVATERFAAGEREAFFFIVSRLIPYKRIDLAVAAFNQLGLPLVIAGEGRDRAALEAAAGPNVRFLGKVSDDEVADWMGRARAFIFPGEEDFGITPVEAAAAGTPVIAFGRGGARDTVIEGETGLFFDEPTADSLADAVRRFESSSFDRVQMQRHAQRFDTAQFKAQITAWVEAQVTENKQRRTQNSSASSAALNSEQDSSADRA
ncbi:MAG: glycosyltransferase [Ardenticatenales bacterium]|nr:glycosyltransferase [Ardenticatenales bacterium]MCB9171317.1 glycosyltransferase [Ardenticatenales bacterium]